MTDPNAAASPQSVADSLSGTDGNGNQLPWRKVAMFYDANLFGLPTDYAFSEGPNVSSSVFDVVTSLGKLLTRKIRLADGNDYDAWDMLVTNTKDILARNPHINDNEPNSVNYKGPQ